METGSQHGSTEIEYEDSSETNQTANDVKDSSEIASHFLESIQHPKPADQHHSELKWNALQTFYVDGYAELLRNDLAEGYYDGVPSIQLEQSQIGAVIWSPDEKGKLYQALSRKGYRDLTFLAKAIGSKSQLEIQDYLLLLRGKESERNLFHRVTKTVSHADIPAAVEISPGAEEALEQAADAQLAYEEYYGTFANAQKNDNPWIFDSQEAEKLDEIHDKAADALIENGGTPNDATFETPIFRVSMFIELSKRLFMNYGDSSIHRNWRTVAMKGETPAMTQDVVSELYDLAINFSRKLIQTSLFLAQSRLRATTNSHYRHRATVKERDVAAAISVLDLKGDLWNFWVGVPRRNKLKVVDDRHRKGGYSKKKSMSYAAVEQILSKRKARWRGRRRSNSVGTDDMTDDEAFDTADQMDEESPDDHGSDSESSARSSSPSSEEYTREPEVHPLDAVLDSDSSESSSGDISSDSPHRDTEGFDEIGGFGFHGATPHQNERQMRLQEEEDEHLEQIDAEASREEETHLLETLGREAPEKFKPENDDDTAMLVRPKVLRKSTDDMRDPLQSQKYGAEWELFGAAVPIQSFTETERARKRPRTATKEAATEPKKRSRGGRHELAIRTRNRVSIVESRHTSGDEL